MTIGLTSPLKGSTLRCYRYENEAVGTKGVFKFVFQRNRCALIKIVIRVVSTENSAMIILRGLSNQIETLLEKSQSLLLIRRIFHFPH